MLHQKKRGRTIDSFFKPRDDESNSDAPSSSKAQRVEPHEVGARRVEPQEVDARRVEPQEVDARRVEPQEIDITSLERDPGLRRSIMKYPVNQRDEVRRAYAKLGAFHLFLHTYPSSVSGNQNRKFQASWFRQFPWLEYSQTKDTIFCFPCFLFEEDPPKHPVFTTVGFKDWRRVNDGERCKLLKHVGKVSSPHLSAVMSLQTLMKPSRHVNKLLNAQSKEVVERNRLRLKTTIKAVRWLALQACALRGCDESVTSNNRGNFIELIKYSADISEEINGVVLENAPGNAKYTAPKIQKEILHLLANKVRSRIREEVRKAKWCLLVDESRDESKKEQMVIILRFVNKDGLVVERFFDVQHVEDTVALTLKKKILDVLTCFNLHIDDMRGQGYDGASNMRGTWNGLQALFLKKCPYAYYVHCFAHRLQLALVRTSKDLGALWKFFSMLDSIVNFVTASSKRHDELQSAQGDEIARKLASGELENGKGANQIGTLHRAGATRWSSHYNSVCSLINMFNATCIVVKNISEDTTSQYRGEADSVHDEMKSFKFVFVLHLVKRIMGITEILCQALQQKSQDIVNAMNLVSTTKTLLLKLRESGWNSFIEGVGLFCKEHDIYMPDMSTLHMTGTGRSCQQTDCITKEHLYRIDIFNTVIDFQLAELNNRFSEEKIELLILCSALDPRESFKLFKINDICRLAEKFYPQDFTKQDIIGLRCQLEHYEIDVLHHSSFQSLSTISELCRCLVETKKSEIYNLVDRVIRLVLTLPISTATAERAFSVMKIVKTALRSKMDDEFLRDCMILNIERDFAESIEPESIIAEFNSIKDRRVQLE